MFGEIDLINIWHEAAASLSYLNTGFILAAGFWTVAIIYSIVREFFFLRLRIGQMGGDGLTPQQRAAAFNRKPNLGDIPLSPSRMVDPSHGESRRNW